MSQTHIVIVPYFSEREVDRYFRIADHMAELGNQQTRFSFLLASSPLISPNSALQERLVRIAPVATLTCPTQIFGYPIGPTAMFWDCMDYIAAHDNGDGGFSLWLESDMLPVKQDWLDRLAAEWQQAGDVLVMGRYVPNVYRRRLFHRRKLWIEQHINGGACYAKSLAREVPKSYRQGAFDVTLFPFLERHARYCCTESISFSTVDDCHRDMADPRRALLHGFMQDKEAFLQRCLKPVPSTAPSGRAASDPMQTWKRWWTLCRLYCFHRGKQTLLEAVFFEQAVLAAHGAKRSVPAAMPALRRAA